MARQALQRSNVVPMRAPPEKAALTLLEFETPTAAVLATPVRPLARHVFWSVLSLVVLSTAVFALFPVDVVVTAPGRVVSKQPAVVVQPLETAIVRAINVQEGQFVRAGDVLARLDPTFASADVGALEAQVRSFQAEVARLEAEFADKPYQPVTADPTAAVQAMLHGQRQAQYRSQLESYNEKINSLQAQLAGAESAVAGFRKRLEIATELEAKWAELERKEFGSKMKRLEAQDQRVEMQRTLNDALAAEQKLNRDLKQVTAEREAFQQHWKTLISQELSERRRSLTDVEESLRKATLRRELVELRAEKDAIVLTVAKVSVGSVMQSGDQFFTLVPTDAPMEVEARIAGDDAGFVRTGHEVSIKFNTFPYVRYGTASGAVRTISADSFGGAGEEMVRGAAAQGPAGLPYYKTRISIDAIGMHDVPGGFQLKPGMPVTADIRVGERTLLMSVMSRVLPAALEGMREP